MKNILYKLKSNHKGASSIEIIIGIMMLIMVLSFATDILILSWKFSVISQTNTWIARVAGIQGGVRTSAPAGYPDEYITIQNMNEIVSDKLSSAGIEPGKWLVQIGNGRLGKNGVSSSSAYDYKTFFDTSIEIEYKWQFMSNFIPGDLRNTIKSKRPAMSEWKHNYDSWIGE